MLGKCHADMYAMFDVILSRMQYSEKLRKQFTK